MLLWAMALGCAPAATFSDGRMLVSPGFSIDRPDEQYWEVQRNRLNRGEPLVVFKYIERGVGSLSFRMLDVPEQATQVPLEVLAEAVFRTQVVSGAVVQLDYSHRVVVGDQQAVATLGRWSIRPLTQHVAQILVYSPDGLIVITLVAPQEHMTALTPELDRVLRGFVLVTDAFIDPFLLDTIPFKDPEEDPGHFGP